MGMFLFNKKKYSNSRTINVYQVNGSLYLVLKKDKKREKK